MHSKKSPYIVPVLCLAISGLLASGCESRRVGAASSGPLDLEFVDRSNGAPCAGISVEVHFAGHVVARGSSSEAGSVHFSQVAPGNLLVRFQDPKESFCRGEAEIEVPGTHRVALEPGVMVDLRIEGESGEPVTGARITVWPLEANVLRFDLQPGATRFGPLPAGSAKLLVAAPSYRTAVLDVDLRSSRKKKEEKLNDVRLVKGGTTLRGRVELKGRHDPKEALLRYEGAGQLAQIQKDGTFEFTGLPDPGPGTKGKDVMLVLRRGSTEVCARELMLQGQELDLGTIALRE